MKAVEVETEVNYVGDMTNHRNDVIPLTILSGRQNYLEQFQRRG